MLPFALCVVSHNTILGLVTVDLNWAIGGLRATELNASAILIRLGRPQVCGISTVTKMDRVPDYVADPSASVDGEPGPRFISTPRNTRICRYCVLQCVNGAASTATRRCGTNTARHSQRPLDW